MLPWTHCFLLTLSSGVLARSSSGIQTLRDLHSLASSKIDISTTEHVRRTTIPSAPLLSVSRPSHHATLPKSWSSYTTSDTIDFKPWLPEKCTMSLTRRHNAATIPTAMIYELTVNSLFDLTGATQFFGVPMLPISSWQGGMRLGFLAFSISSRWARSAHGTIPAFAIGDALATIQQLSHQLGIQEMDFELYYTLDDRPEAELVAAGCLAFRGCGYNLDRSHTLTHKVGNLSPKSSHPPALTLPTNGTSTTANETALSYRIDFDIVDEPLSSPIPSRYYTDAICNFFHYISQLNIAGGGGIQIMPTPRRSAFKLRVHEYEIMVDSFGPGLLLAVGQTHGALYNITLDEITRNLNALIGRGAQGRLKPARGQVMSREHSEGQEPIRVGSFCICFDEDLQNFCGDLFDKSELSPWNP